MKKQEIKIADGPNVNMAENVYPYIGVHKNNLVWFTEPGKGIAIRTDAACDDYYNYNKIITSWSEKFYERFEGSIIFK